MYIIYGGEGCGYCVQAKKLLESKGVKLQYKDIYNKVPSGEGTYRDELLGLMDKMKLPPPRSIPQIFLDAGDDFVYIGGFNELKKSLEE